MQIPSKFPTTIWDGTTTNNWRADRNADVNPDFEDWDRIASEVIGIETELGASMPVGVKNGAAVVATETGVGAFRKTTLTITALNVATVDADTAGAHGSHRLYDFPNCNLLYLGGISDLVITRVGVSIDVDAVLVSSVGTTAVVNDNATLTTTEADLISSTATTLADGTGTGKGISGTVAAFNGTGTAKDAILNIAVAAADHGAGADAFTVSGTVVLHWMNLGDN